MFCRDRKVFENEFPAFKIVGIHQHTSFAYLLSGGLTLRQLVPSFTYSLVKVVEAMFYPLNLWLGMFQTIELQNRISVDQV